MTDDDHVDEDLTGEELVLAERLEERPAPAPSFRGALSRHLAAGDPGYGPRPERLRLTVLGYLAGGLLLLALGALQATGSL